MYTDFFLSMKTFKLSKKILKSDIFIVWTMFHDHDGFLNDLPDY